MEADSREIFLDRQAGVHANRYNDMHDSCFRSKYLCHYETETMHGLDESKDVTIETNPDGTSAIYYYAKENKGGYNLFVRYNSKLQQCFWQQILNRAGRAVCFFK